MARDEALEEFSEELFQDVVSTSAALQIYKEEALFEIFSGYLVDAGEFEETIYAHYQPARGGIRIDGYCGDPLDDMVYRAANSGTLGIIVLDLNPGAEIRTIPITEINQAFKRATNFMTRSLDVIFRAGMEETDPGYEVADLISRRWDVISKVKIYLFTNRTLSGRAGGKDSEVISGKQVQYDVWDLSRLYRLVKSGRERETLVVDFNDLPGGPLRALRASASDGGNEVYLAAVPGLDLATIYDRWGTRLLEQNVRVFLQARSNVNKAIKNTLENDPELFFSFNNGLTATAERIETGETDAGTVVSKLENLQIVNGGQTTASIYAAYKKGVDLGKVFVQMKLSIVTPDAAKDLVPRISRSANSQNKVSDADFFSNHPFHVRIEGFSRRLYAPPQEGSFIQTKWFYERARGQYRDQQAYLSAAGKKQFKQEYPQQQVFTKTDLAKYLMVWTDKGYFVNRGAQKNFAEFAKAITEDWEKDELQFNEHYFRVLVAKKIVFNATERIVTSRPWYESGGYRAQHVVLTIGALAKAVEDSGRLVDFEAVWSRQAVPPILEAALARCADVAHQVLMNPGQGYRNISEWAKQPQCWAKLRESQIVLPEGIEEALTNPNDEREARSEAKRDQAELNGIEAQAQVVSMGAAFWGDVLSWCEANGEGTEKERGILKTATKLPSTIPSDRQSKVLLDLMQRLERIGCPHRMGRARRRGRRAR